MFNFNKYIGLAVNKLFTGKPLPAKPNVLNFMANNICNSRCMMCNVWKGKEETNLTPQELRHVLSDPLFSDLEYIGVSGGEPTLRKDIDEIFKVFVSSVKNIKGIGLITNGINIEQVLTSIDKINAVCKLAKVPFNVMVSLDGIGEMHDAVRGKSGNFASAVHVLRYLRDNTDIPVSIGCTIIKENVWNVDEVLQFCRDENIYGRFRIGEFIDRLYNKDLGDQIRNFNDDESYQIALFFSKLYHSYETSPEVKATYRNIIGMIEGNQPRLNGCPYRHSAISMDCSGNLLYCSPKSPKLGSSLQKSAFQIYRKNLNVRQQIIEEHCNFCIHDYHDTPSAIFQEMDALRQDWADKLSVASALSMAKNIEPVLVKETTKIHKPLIIGWYGTETAGDKAILDEIIYRILGNSPEAKISIASMYPFITRRTLKELGHKNVAIVETYSPAYFEACRNSDAVIMGGGPLMGMEPLGFVLAAFAAAAEAGVPTIIDGCGIGPVSEDKHVEAIKEIIRLASVVRVRDTKSLEWIIQNTDRNDAMCSGDPAVGFVSRFNDVSKNAGGNVLACYLREITTEYMGEMTYEQFLTFRDKFEEELAVLIKHVCNSRGLKPLFMPMHTFVIGNDDRDFARRFTKKYLADVDYEIGDKIYSPNAILATMQDASLCLCMRFHSVVFAEILQRPYIAIDYTGGGKIRGFLQDKGKMMQYLDRQVVADGAWLGHVKNQLSCIK